MMSSNAYFVLCFGFGALLSIGLHQEGIFRVSVPMEQLLASKALIDTGTSIFSVLNEEPKALILT